MLGSKHAYDKTPVKIEQELPQDEVGMAKM